MADGRRFNPDEYVPVSVRIEKFIEKYPEGHIETEIVSVDDKKVLAKARIWRSDKETRPAATGHAEEVRSESLVNKTSAVENAETSAVGRALAFLGFEVKKGIASQEEMRKVAERGTGPAAESPEAVATSSGSPVPSLAPEYPKESESSEKEVCQVCGTNVSQPPISNWLATKRAKEGAEFGPICPTCFRAKK